MSTLTIVADYCQHFIKTFHIHLHVYTDFLIFRDFIKWYFLFPAVNSSVNYPPQQQVPTANYDAPPSYDEAIDDIFGLTNENNASNLTSHTQTTQRTPVTHPTNISTTQTAMTYSYQNSNRSHGVHAVNSRRPARKSRNIQLVSL